MSANMDCSSPSVAGCCCLASLGQPTALSVGIKESSACVFSNTNWSALGGSGYNNEEEVVVEVVGWEGEEEALVPEVALLLVLLVLGGTLQGTCISCTAGHMPWNSTNRRRSAKSLGTLFTLQILYSHVLLEGNNMYKLAIRHLMSGCIYIRTMTAYRIVIFSKLFSSRGPTTSYTSST